MSVYYKPSEMIKFVGDYISHLDSSSKQYNHAVGLLNYYMENMCVYECTGIPAEYIIEEGKSKEEIAGDFLNQIYFYKYKHEH